MEVLKGDREEGRRVGQWEGGAVVRRAHGCPSHLGLWAEPEQEEGLQMQTRNQGRSSGKPGPRDLGAQRRQAA